MSASALVAVDELDARARGHRAQPRDGLVDVLRRARAVTTRRALNRVASAIQPV